MLGNLRGFEWVIIGAIVLLLFGAKRLPDAARGLGRSLRIFKAETKGLAEDSAKSDAAAPATEATPAAPPAVPAAPATPSADAAPPAVPAPPAAPERTEG